MDPGFTGVLAGILFLFITGNSFNNPELVEPPGKLAYEVYVPAAGPDCLADPYSVRSDCER